MKSALSLLLLFIHGILKAQVYTPDTSFKFQNASIEFPSYRVQYVSEVNSKVMIARIERPAGGVNDINPAENAVIDTEGNVLANFEGYYIANSLTEEGFLYVAPSDPLNGRTSQTIFFNIKTLAKTPLNQPLSAVDKIENERIIVKTNHFKVYDLRGNLLSTLDINYLGTSGNSKIQFYIGEVRVDENKNVWVWVSKETEGQAAVLQLYRLSPEEKLMTSNHLVFEKSLKELGINGQYLRGNVAFENNTLVIRSTDLSRKLWEMRKIDFEGNFTSFKVSLPLEAHPEGYYKQYSFLRAKNTDYLVIDILREGFFFVDNQGNVSKIQVLDRQYDFERELKIEDNKLYYKDTKANLHEIDIKTLKDSIKKVPVSTGRFEGQISFIQSLTNADYWIGYRDPYKTSWNADNERVYVKYRREKEIFRFPKVAKAFLYMGGKTVLLQSFDDEKIRIDENNQQTQLPQIEGRPVYVDTLHQHIYSVNDDKLLRYSFNAVPDTEFKWEGGKLMTNIVVTDDGKIFHAGGLFSPNGQKETGFEEIKISRNGNGVHITHLKKVWNTVFLFDGECSEGCYGVVYRYEQKLNKYIKLDLYSGFYPYFLRHESIVGRDSLLLVGFDKTLPDLKIDSSLQIKGKFRDSFNKYYYLPSSNKWVDILPDKRILATLDNRLYRYHTKNPLWVEIRNLPSYVVLTDSLKKNGLSFETFSSDGSEVTVKVRNEIHTYDRGVVTASQEHIGKTEGKKLVLGGQTGRLTLVAQSRNGGQPYYATIEVGLPQSQSSYISLKDTALYVDFKPFRPTYYNHSDPGLPLTVEAEGEGGYWKEGLLYPTGKPGVIHITISHKSTLRYAAQRKTFTLQVNRYAQTISYSGRTSPNSVYHLSALRFPFKIPGATSSKLPLVYATIDGNNITDKLFYIRQDTIYLKPDYESILMEEGWNSIEKPIRFVVNGNQAGNDLYNPVNASFSVEFNYWIDKLASQEVTVFPNPLSTYFYIASVKGNVSEVYLYDLSGKEAGRLKSEADIPLGVSANKVETTGNYFSTLQIPRGTYLLVFYVDGKRYTKKVTK